MGLSQTRWSHSPINILNSKDVNPQPRKFLDVQSLCWYYHDYIITAGIFFKKYSISWRKYIEWEYYTLRSVHLGDSMVSTALGHDFLSRQALLKHSVEPRAICIPDT